jgi:predicted chitinase
MVNFIPYTQFKAFLILISFIDFVSNLEQWYFGRGFIQLTHCYNYRACSRDLYGDDRFVKNPDLVASDDNIAMATALWFWCKNVHRVAKSCTLIRFHYKSY